MNELLAGNYKTARYEAARFIKSEKGSLAGTIDYLSEQGLMQSFSLHEYLSIYDERLGFKTDMACGSSWHSLAHIEHEYELHKRVAALFESVASLVEGKKGSDPYLFSVIDRTRTEIPQVKEAVDIFFEKYCAEIADEMASPEYARDKDVIKEVVGELEKASRFGQWTPEFVTITDTVTGRRRPAELPSSEGMGRIARMAPQLKKLGFNLGDV